MKFGFKQKIVDFQDKARLKMAAQIYREMAGHIDQALINLNAGKIEPVDIAHLKGIKETMLESAKVSEKNAGL